MPLTLALVSLNVFAGLTGEREVMLPRVRYPHLGPQKRPYFYPAGEILQ